MTKLARRMQQAASGLAVAPITFDPSLITWTSAWWASDPDWTPPANGAEVSSWRDYSGNNDNWAQTNASYQPTYYESVALLNNNPGITFNGSDDHMTVTRGDNLTQPTSAFYIFRYRGGDATARVLLARGTYQYLSFNDAGNNNQMYANLGTQLATYPSGAFTGSGDGNLMIVTAKYHAGTSKLDWLNSSVMGSTGAGDQDFQNEMVLGAYNTSNAYSIAMDLAFVGFYNGDLSANPNYADLIAGAQNTYDPNSIVSTSDYPEMATISGFSAWHGSSGWTLSRNQQTGHLGAAEMRNTTSSDGDYIYTYDTLAKGTWTCQVIGAEHTAAGITELFIDGVSKGTFDQYGTSTYNVVQTISGFTITTNGVHEIKFKVSGKNGSSSGYEQYFGQITFIRTGD